jgi:hypothetical protein
VAFPIHFPVSRSKTRSFKLCGTLVRNCPRPIITTSGKWVVETHELGLFEPQIPFLDKSHGN